MPETAEETQAVQSDGPSAQRPHAPANGVARGPIWRRNGRAPNGRVANGRVGPPPRQSADVDATATTTPPAADREPAGTTDGTGEFDRGLLASDMRIAFLLLNEARYRTIERLFGVSRDQANLVTAIAALVIARAARDTSTRTSRTLKGPGGPKRGDAVLGGAMLNQVLADLAGPSSKEMPAMGALIAIALVAAGSGPAVRRSARSVRAFSHELRHTFNHRYGRLIGPSQPRPGASA